MLRIKYFIYNKGQVWLISCSKCCNYWSKEITVKVHLIDAHRISFYCSTKVKQQFFVNISYNLLFLILWERKDQKAHYASLKYYIYSIGYVIYFVTITIMKTITVLVSYILLCSTGFSTKPHFSMSSTKPHVTQKTWTVESQMKKLTWLINMDKDFQPKS